MAPVAVQLLQAGHGVAVDAKRGHAEDVAQVSVLFLQSFQLLLPVPLLL